MQSELEPTTAAPPTTSRPPPATRILFVDLDGTLVKGDLLCEGLLAATKSSPRNLLRVLAAAVRGRTHLKECVTDCSRVDVASLPLRGEVLDLIASVRASGGRVVLATAAHRRLAETIARELGVFDDVLATDAALNLKGAAKQAAIASYCRRHGFATFDYVGDCSADLPIWSAAATAYLVAPAKRLANKLQSGGRLVTVLGPRPPVLRPLVRSLRIRQWAKNLLLFVPAITSHRLLELPILAAAVLAFVGFCLCSSGVYVINDLFDIHSDRRHPLKRKRPFAAGDLSIVTGLGLAALLLSAGLAVAILNLPPPFCVLLAAYVALTTAYSLWMKRVVMLDVVTLACLYAVRVLGGGLATGIPVSEWLMAFSLFIFLSLAFAKRYAELGRLAASGGESADGRGYQVSDLSLIEGMGPACGYLAVLVLALYIQSEQMRQLYTGSWALWLLCPLLAYWIGRIWILAKRGTLGEDPVVFAIQDSVSWLLAAAAAALLVAGSM